MDSLKHKIHDRIGNRVAFGIKHPSIDEDIWKILWSRTSSLHTIQFHKHGIMLFELREDLNHKRDNP